MASPPPRLSRTPHSVSDRATCLHGGRARHPAPTLASTRAAWLREGRAWQAAPVPVGRQAAWKREDMAWQQALATIGPSDRAAVMQLSRQPFEAGSSGSHTYYLVLFGHLDGGIRFEVDTAYVLLRAQELAGSAAAWFEASHFIAESTLKIDAGIQGRVEGILWGLKGRLDLNVVKADLLTTKVNMLAPLHADSWDVDYAGKNGKTQISNGITAQVELPWLPQTPWGKLAVGGMAEQSQWIDGNGYSSGAKQDWGLYAIVPVLQPKRLKKAAEVLKANPATQMAKPPGYSNKEGKQKDFYGLDVGIGAALLIGVSGQVKVGFKK